SQASINGAARRVNIELDRFLRIRTLEKEHLSDQKVRDRVVHFGAEKDDSIEKHARINVVLAFAARGLLDDDRIRYVVTDGGSYRSGETDGFRLDQAIRDAGQRRASGHD